MTPATGSLALVALLFGPSLAAVPPQPPPPTEVPIAQKGAVTLAATVISLTGTATVAGELLFHFTPVGGETTEIRAKVKAGAPAGDVANDLARALRSALAPAYAVSRPGASAVRVAFGAKRARFRLNPAAAPTPGLRITLR